MINVGSCRSGGKRDMGMKIAVRMDDITPDMNWDNFNFFLKLFEQAGISPLLGIVPDNRDRSLVCGAAQGDFYGTMKSLENKGFVLAMHGYHHVYTTKRSGLFPLNRQSEFAGVPYGKQREMLKAGREILKQNGIDTDIFMAPAHSYDRNTLKALKEAGFTRMTDGFGKMPYVYRGLTFYPISFMFSQSLRLKDGATTLVLHANTVTEAEKERYTEIFKKYGKNMISYSEYLKMEPVTRTVFGRALEYLLAKCKYLLVRLKKRF